MNILYITNHLNIGGITTYVLSLAREMKKRGHGVYVASSAGELLPEFTKMGIEFIPIPIRTKSELSPKIILSFLKLKGFIRKYKIELAHSNSRTTQVLGCLVSRASGIAHISTCHGFFKARFWRRLFPCWGDKVIAISEEVRRHLIKDFAVDEKKIALIHSGVDIEKFKIPCLSGRQENSNIKNEKKKELGLGQGPVIGIIARLSEEKGHIYLIQAMKIILERVPAAQLLIAGRGRVQEKLELLVKELGIDRSVFFIPQIQDTSRVLPALDLFVLPSLKEGLGLALMEAMACGLPVVGSNIGGIKSLIKDGICGLLVEPADAAALAQAALRILENPAQAESFGRQACIFIAENFSLERMTTQTERVYSECLSQKN